MIDCLPERQDILVAIKKLYSFEFRASLSALQNPYGEGGASEKILEVIKSRSFNNLVKKVFFDVNLATLA